MGCRDGIAVENTCYSFRGTEFHFGHPHDANNCDTFLSSVAKRYSQWTEKHAEQITIHIKCFKN